MNSIMQGIGFVLGTLAGALIATVIVDLADAASDWFREHRCTWCDRWSQRRLFGIERCDACQIRDDRATRVARARRAMEP